MTRAFVYIVVLVQLTVVFAQSDSTSSIFVRQVLIEGNHKTKPQIITRELSFDEGASYRRFELDSMFEWDRNRIYNTNLFNTVDFSLENVEDGSADIVITVDERWYFYPIPIFKLADRNFNDWWVNRGADLSRVNIGLKLTQYNFRGRAERLRMVAQFGFENLIRFGYRIPYIEKTQRHGLNIEFGYSETKNLAFDTEDNIPTFLEAEDVLRTVHSAGVTHSYRSSFYSFHFLRAGFTNINVADTIVTLNPNYLGFAGGETGSPRTNQRSFDIGYSFVWDKRNNRNYPTSGEWYTAGIRKFGLGIYDHVDFLTMDFTVSKYKDLGKNWYYAGNVMGLLSFPNERSYANYSAIGFRQRVLRGHDLFIVEGSDFFIQKNEIKKQLFSHSQDISKVMPVRQFQTFPITLFGKVFFDQGYARSFPGHDGSALLDNRYLYSYGVGLDVMIIYDAVFRFELSQNTLGQTNFFINFGAAL